AAAGLFRRPLGRTVMWLLLCSHQPLYMQLVTMLLGLPKLILRLLGEPALRRCVERNGKAQRHFRTNASLAIENGAQSLAAGAECLRSVRDGKTERLQAQLPQYFAGVGWIVHAHNETSVIVLVV